MRLSFLWACLCGILVVLSLARCSKPTLVGSELVDLDQTPLDRSDTFSLELRSFPVDSFMTWRPGTTALINRYPVGRVEDPFFGNGETVFYFELVPAYGFSEPDFTNAVFDSLVLSIGADTSWRVGTVNPAASLQVFRLEERLPADTLYSTDGFSLGQMPVGVFPGPVWPVPVNTYFSYAVAGVVDTLTRTGYRFRIDDAVAQEIMALDSVHLVTDSLFLETLPGFGVRFDAPSDAWIGMAYNNINTHLTLYYTVSDTIRRQAQWIPISLNTPQKSHLQYTIDRQTVTYPDLLLDNKSGDPVHFLQGLAGHDIQVHFPWLSQQELVLVNHALLELTVCALDGEDPNTFGPADQLDMYTYDDTGKEVAIDDVTFALKSGTFGLQNYFGGQPVTDSSSGKITYRFNISAQVQKILEGKAQPFVYIRTRSRTNTPGRVILCGATDADAARLTVTYTRLNP